MMRRLLDNMRPHFEGQGKLRRFYALYEATDTFVYTPGEVTCGDVQIRDALDLKRMMTHGRRGP